MSVAFGNFYQEYQQLQAFLVCQVGGNLRSAVTDGVFKCQWVLSVHLLALFEEVEQYPFSLAHGSLTECASQKAADEFHFTMHDAPVCTDNVRSHHEHGEEETVPLPGIGSAVRWCFSIITACVI